APCRAPTTLPTRRSSDLFPSPTFCKKKVACFIRSFLFILFLNEKAAFSWTFNQGNSAASWNTTPLSELGLMTRDPSNQTVPEVRSEEHTSELQSRFDLVC